MMSRCQISLFQINSWGSYPKVAGAVRPRINVTLEATNKRLLLAAHYGQVRRNYELIEYNKLLTILGKSNMTLATTILDAAELKENGTVISAYAQLTAAEQTLGAVGLRNDYHSSTMTLYFFSHWPYAIHPYSKLQTPSSS